LPKAIKKKSLRGAQQRGNPMQHIVSLRGAQQRGNPMQHIVSLRGVRSATRQSRSPRNAIRISRDDRLPEKALFFKSSLKNIFLTS